MRLIFLLAAAAATSAIASPRDALNDYRQQLTDRCLVRQSSNPNVAVRCACITEVTVRHMTIKEAIELEEAIEAGGASVTSLPQYRRIVTRLDECPR